MSEIPSNYICTRQEIREIIARCERFSVARCQCRENHPGGCRRSRHDVCLNFTAAAGGSMRDITRAEVEELLREAEAKHLVVRPFRDEARERTVGTCLCCDDCCDCFLHPGKYPCGKGAYIERTDRALCNDCGDCTQVCYFGARRMADGELAVDREACYGCGLCTDVCPADCIEMVPRQSPC